MFWRDRFGGKRFKLTSKRLLFRYENRLGWVGLAEVGDGGRKPENRFGFNGEAQDEV